MVAPLIDTEGGGVMTGFSFATVGRLVCETGAMARLPEYCGELGMRRVLLVSDPGLEAAGLVQRARSSLERGGIGVVAYTQVQADPSEAVVLAAVELARGERVDGVVGFGGGSSMDVAKLAALLAPGAQTLEQVYGIDNARGPRLPLLQVPTTAGTGSEVTPIAIVTTGETTKMGVISPVLLADMAVLDAELTVGLPPHVTAATGIDAMVHAIESFTSRHKKNPLSDHLALKALQLLSGNIGRACERGDDLAARENMLFGALLAGQAFANAPVAAVHALAYPLGGHFHVSHGLSNSLVLPHVLRFNLDAAAPLYAELGTAAFGISEADKLKAANAFIERLETLVGALGVETRLRQVGIAETDLQRLAEDAMQQQRLLVNNPRDVTLDDALAIYRAAY